MHNNGTKLRSDPNQLSYKTLRFAALLHDIGHLPFSHAIEKQWLQGLSHEDLSHYIISNYKPIKTILESEDVSPDDVISLLTKKPLAKDRLFHEIISGQLDADRADYLLRDSHLCGARYGEYDFARFLQIYAATDRNSEGHLILFIDENDLHVAESILISRYHYNLQIPFHRTRMGYDFILSRFMRDFSEYNRIFTFQDGYLTSVDLDKYEDLDDYSIFERIKKEKRTGNIWASYLLRDNHLIPIIDTSSTSAKGVALYKAFVLHLEESNEFNENENYFRKEQPVEVIKGNADSSEKPDPNGHTSSASPELIRLCSREGKKRNPEFVDIRERSWIFKQFTDKTYKIYRVYVTPEMEDHARRLLADVES